MTLPVLNLEICRPMCQFKSDLPEELKLKEYDIPNQIPKNGQLSSLLFLLPKHHLSFLVSLPSG